MNIKTGCFRYTVSRRLVRRSKNAGRRVRIAFYSADRQGKPVYELVREGKRPAYQYVTKRSTAFRLKKEGWKYCGIALYAL